MHTVHNLAAYCLSNPLLDKLLVGTTTLQARLIREKLVRDGHTWLGLGVTSVRGLAESALDTEKQRSAIEAMPSMMEYVCRKSLPDVDEYAAMADQPGMHRAFIDALLDLDLAGIDIESLYNILPDFESQTHILTLIAQRLKSELEQRALLDYPALLQRGITRFRSLPPGQHPVLLIATDTWDMLRPLERELIDAASEGETIILDEVRDADIRVKIHTRSAVAPEHEFREAFRDIIGKGIRYDKVEIVYTDSRRLPELYELCVEYDLPCTFAEGIPVQYSKAARTIQRFLEWVRDGDPFALIRLMYEGIPDFTAFSRGDARANRLPAAALLRDARAGRDPRKVVQRLDRYISQRKAGQEQRIDIDTMQASRDLIAAISDLLPERDAQGDISYQDLLHGMLRLLRDLCRPSSPAEPQAVECIAAALEAQLSGPDFRLREADAAVRILGLLRSLRMPIVLKATGGIAEQTSLPLPGHVYVTDLLHGGLSKRTHAYLIGMDDESMPGARVENPILTDEMRQRLRESAAGPLPLSSDSMHDRIRLLRRFVHRCEGALTASCAYNDATRLRARGPSSELLRLYRCEIGNEKATYGELASALRPPSSDIPQKNWATVQDWWLQLSRNLSPEALAAGLHEQYPMQAAGVEARTARDSDHFTTHDGMTGPFPEDEARFSASTLQSLASCPYRVFLRSLLNLRPPRSMREDARLWLDAAEYGTLVHTVLRQFMQDMRDEALPRDRWSARMQKTLEAAIEEEVERNPPPNRAARFRIERTLRDDCALFLRDEIAATDTTPLAFEVAFPDEKTLPAPLTPLNEPLHLPAPGGGVLLHGQIDRIDSVADNGFHIIDYKTGKNRSDANRPLAGGKQLQPSLYVEALRAMCEDKDVQIAFSYRHISAREQGRIVTVETPLEQTLRCIGLLLELRRNGCFPHATDKEECSYCDYAQLCGDAAQTTTQMKRKLERLENTELNAWRTVRDEF